MNAARLLSSRRAPRSRDVLRSRELLGLLLLIPSLAGAASAPDWASTREFYCTPGRAHANAADDPLIAPTRVFDNLYAIGRNSTTVYVLATSDGLVLIDAGYPDQLDSVLLAGMAKLGLDPARIKYVLVTHGHADHFGGAKVLQQRFGANVGASDLDWATIDRPGPDGAPSIGPKRDVVLEDGKTLVVGEARITPVLVPGHTPGSLGFVFPVRDGNTAHVAALFGGMILLPQRVADAAGLQTFTDSLTHFADVTRRLGVDVELQNHALFDDFEPRLAQLATRRSGAPHPFVVGTAGYQRFLGTITECMNAEVGRRQAQPR